MPEDAEIVIPFNRPALTGREFDYMRQAVANGHLSGDGAFTRRCERLLQEELGCPRVLLTTSCTHALELAALLLALEPGDEVIVPSFTFVSTVNAFVLHGARPVFADIRRDSLNLDEKRLERLITRRTRAIVPVHYAGVGCEMDRLLAIASRHGVALVEDNALGLFGRYRGKPLGTFGALATQSFHETKNFNCGEGGALVLNDERFVDRAEVLRDKGTDRRRFLRGQVDRYTWVDVGSSFLPSELLAAFLQAQLEARERVLTLRRRVWERYEAALRGWARRHGVGLPFIPAHCQPAHSIFYLLLPTPAERQALIAHLAERGIGSVFHYQPLHLSAMGRRFGGAEGDCPVTEEVSERLLRLPFYTELSEADQARVVGALEAFYGE